MIAEKPSWIRHEGMQIFSIDIQPSGLRFATGGGDCKVRIWDMKSVGRELETDESKSNLLATLQDHFGSVNCVRWANHGRFIASGSDDQLILIHELKPSSDTTDSNLENWKLVMTLRGHSADVVDLNWSPDDSSLASASLDNTVHIWDMKTGICKTVLTGHSSLVKGVVWDPIGLFVASQSDDKTVIIWRTSDWTIAHQTDGHRQKSLGSTFFRRLGWSPCGHFITTTHGYQKPRHSAPVLERGKEWLAKFDFLGHSAPIIVVKFNHKMFRKSPSNNSEVKAVLGWSNNGLSKEGENDSNPYNVIALGSQDCTITLWTTANQRPIFVAKHFFSQSVVDLSWSPDGYSLFACSLDGTVATFHFDVTEFGQQLSDLELDELKKAKYGDVKDSDANLLESPLLLLEDACVKPTPKSPSDSKITTKVSKPKNKKKIEGASVNGSNKAAPSIIAPSMAPSIAPLMASSMAPFIAPSIDPSMASSIAPVMALTVTQRKSSPVKQREYIRPDGRKRIIPEAVGTCGTQFQAFDRDENGNNPMINREASFRKMVDGISDFKERSGVTAIATTNDSLVIEKVPKSKDKEGNITIDQLGFVKNRGNLSIRIFNKKDGENLEPICLEARVKEHPSLVNKTTFIKETEISCTKGSQELWSDRIFGKVNVLAGNFNFWAVGCEDGSLQVYTKCGRRALPTIMLGSSPIFIDCDESWKLLLVTKNGSLYVWDILNRKCLLHDTITSLLTSDTKDSGTIKIISAKFSKCGFPIVTLATRHAYLYDTSMMCWLRVADDCFPVTSSCNGGELADLQVDVGKFLTRKPFLSKVSDEGVQTRAHLEAQIASTIALNSPNEYKQCLLSYITFLAREGDESRLREVCESFLGPPSGVIVDDLNKFAWEPLILGMSKQKLLKEDILPAMACNRKVQRLLNEFIHLVSEYEESRIEVENVNSDLVIVTEEMNVDPPPNVPLVKENGC